jgi:hypothetical protein
LAVTRRILAALVLAAAFAAPAAAQSITAEADITGGVTTDKAKAAAVQGRVFGELRYGWRFFAEAAWGKRSGDPSDAFGSAYPYSNRVKAIENYLEGIWHPSGAVVALKAGRYRTPFGLSSRGDHAYSALDRAPLIRYDGYFGLSNNYLEHGASLLAGTPAVNVQVSLGRPADVGSVRRRAGLDTVVRAQAYGGPLIVGVSFSRTLPYQPISFAPGHAQFTGVDARFMRGGIELRGEWIGGHPFSGTKTRGGYADLIAHRRAMGPLTLVARAEYLDYDAAAPFAASGSRYSIGARVRLPRGFTAQAALAHKTGNLAVGSRDSALDAALTYSVRWR